MFVCKLGTLFWSNYEHCHVYLAYIRQTGTVATRQTYDPLHTFQGVNIMRSTQGAVDSPIYN